MVKNRNSLPRPANKKQTPVAEKKIKNVCRNVNRLKTEFIKKPPENYDHFDQDEQSSLSRVSSPSQYASKKELDVSKDDNNRITNYSRGYHCICNKFLTFSKSDTITYIRSSNFVASTLGNKCKACANKQINKSIPLLKAESDSITELKEPVVNNNNTNDNNLYSSEDEKETKKTCDVKRPQTRRDRRCFKMLENKSKSLVELTPQNSIPRNRRAQSESNSRTRKQEYFKMFAAKSDKGAKTYDRRASPRSSTSRKSSRYDAKTGRSVHQSRSNIKTTAHQNKRISSGSYLSEFLRKKALNKPGLEEYAPPQCKEQPRRNSPKEKVRPRSASPTIEASIKLSKALSIPEVTKANSQSSAVSKRTNESTHETRFILAMNQNLNVMCDSTSTVRGSWLTLSNIEISKTDENNFGMLLPRNSVDTLFTKKHLQKDTMLFETRPRPKTRMQQKTNCFFTDPILYPKHNPDDDEKLPRGYKMFVKDNSPYEDPIKSVAEHKKKDSKEMQIPIDYYSSDSKTNSNGEELQKYIMEIEDSPEMINKTIAIMLEGAIPIIKSMNYENYYSNENQLATSCIASGFPSYRTNRCTQEEFKYPVRERCPSNSLSTFSYPPSATLTAIPEESLHSLEEQAESTIRWIFKRIKQFWLYIRDKINYHIQHNPTFTFCLTVFIYWIMSVCQFGGQMGNRISLDSQERVQLENNPTR